MASSSSSSSTIFDPPYPDVFAETEVRDNLQNESAYIKMGSGSQVHISN